LNICSKIYSWALNARIKDWVDHQSIIGEEQAGFRAEHSTMDHVFTLYAMIQKQLIRHRKFYVAYIDFKKDFDNVSRSKLWGVLKRNGIDKKMLRALRGMYEVVRAKVRLCGDYTVFFVKMV
jgi:hypothetical protein